MSAGSYGPRCCFRTALCAIHHNFQKISSQEHSKGKQTENQFQKNIQLRITHPTKSSKTLQDIIVDETGLRRITEGLVQEVVDEVDARLDGEHHALLQAAGGAQAPEPRQVNALHSLRKNTGSDGQEDNPWPVFYQGPPMPLHHRNPGFGYARYCYSLPREK